MRNQLSRFSNVEPGSTKHLWPLEHIFPAPSLVYARTYNQNLTRLNIGNPTLRLRSWQPPVTESEDGHPPIILFAW